MNASEAKHASTHARNARNGDAAVTSGSDNIDTSSGSGGSGERKGENGSLRTAKAATIVAAFAIGPSHHCKKFDPPNPMWGNRLPWVWWAVGVGRRAMTVQ